MKKQNHTDAQQPDSDFGSGDPRKKFSGNPQNKPNFKENGPEKFDDSYAFLFFGFIGGFLIATAFWGCLFLIVHFANKPNF
jgi:hypothetical protein